MKFIGTKLDLCNRWNEKAKQMRLRVKDLKPKAKEILLKEINTLEQCATELEMLDEYGEKLK